VRLSKRSSREDLELLGQIYYPLDRDRCPIASPPREDFTDPVIKRPKPAYESRSSYTAHILTIRECSVAIMLPSLLSCYPLLRCAKASRIIPIMLRTCRTFSST